MKCFITVCSFTLSQALVQSKIMKRRVHSVVLRVERVQQYQGRKPYLSQIRTAELRNSFIGIGCTIDSILKLLFVSYLCALIQNRVFSYRIIKEDNLIMTPNLCCQYICIAKIYADLFPLGN